MTTERECPMTIPTMTFDSWEGCSFSFPHDDPMVVELKVVSALVCRILIDTGSLANIITWDYLKKLKHSEKDITPLVHQIMGFVR